MELRARFDQREVVLPGEISWQASPVAGVERKMLDRVGAEVARATSLVRYEPGSRFPRHIHGGGEEFLVLNGVFSDEFGDYPAGTYVRNPPGSDHEPWSKPGAVIFVKLQQFDPADLQRVVVKPDQYNWEPGSVGGLLRHRLHRYREEEVTLQHWESGVHCSSHTHAGGEEILVLEGELEDEYGCYPAGTWIRQPAGSSHEPFTRTGCRLYAKTGHLPG